MSGERKKNRKKKLFKFTITAVITVIIIGGLAFFYYQYKNQQQAQEAAKNARYDSAKQKVAQMAQKGDVNLATEYTAALLENDEEKARLVYINKVNAESDIAEKQALLSQYANVAYENKKYNHQLDARLEIDKLESTYMTLYMISSAYDNLNDKGKQVEYLDRAITALGSVSQDENTMHFKELFTALRNQAKDEG